METYVCRLRASPENVGSADVKNYYLWRTRVRAPEFQHAGALCLRHHWNPSTRVSLNYVIFEQRICGATLLPVLKRSLTV